MSVEDSSWGIGVNIGSACGKFVYLALCAYADADGVTRATQVNVAAITGMTRRSVIKHVNNLVASGLVLKDGPGVYRVVGIPGGGSTFLEKRSIEVRRSPSRWGKIRRVVLERDSFLCAYCGRTADTVDHIVPQVRGGSDDTSNLVAACRRCNSSKCAKPLDMWRARESA